MLSKHLKQVLLNSELLRWGIQPLQEKKQRTNIVSSIPSVHVMCFTEVVGRLLGGLTVKYVDEDAKSKQSQEINSQEASL